MLKEELMLPFNADNDGHIVNSITYYEYNKLTRLLVYQCHGAIVN